MGVTMGNAEEFIKNLVPVFRSDPYPVIGNAQENIIFFFLQVDADHRLFAGIFQGIIQ